MKIRFLFFPLWLVLSALCISAPPAPAHAATEAQASRYISDIGDQVIAIIRNKTTPRAQKAGTLEGIFADSVDFPWVARFVMGRFWREASETQRARYTELYQRFLVRHYASLFSEYSGGSFRILHTRDDGDGEFTIGLQIQSGVEAGEPVVIDFRVRAGNASRFKVFDVIIEGVSMLTTQRAEFTAILNDKGIDYLIEQLEKKADLIAARHNSQ